MLAISYAFFSISTSLFSAYMEGTLFVSEKLIINGIENKNHAFIENISTILDFSILNPFVIGILISFRKSTQYVLKRFNKKSLLPFYHQVGLALISVAIASKAMIFILMVLLMEVALMPLLEFISQGMWV